MSAFFLFLLSVLEGFDLGITRHAPTRAPRGEHAAARMEGDTPVKPDMTAVLADISNGL